MRGIFEGFSSIGNLDYVACWFWKGANYIKGSSAELAFVATNSLCQGEQVAVLWPSIFDLDLHIHLAYPTFPWANNARDKAAVHVIIVGLTERKTVKTLFQQIDGTWHSKQVANISPYLVEGSNTSVLGRSKPFAETVLPIVFGNKPTDGGYLLLDRNERDELIKKEPLSQRWIKSVLGATEFLNAKERWCIWLDGVEPEQLGNMPLIKDRVDGVNAFRLASKKASTRKKAATPHLFDENRQPKSGSYILIPIHSSQRRSYVPIGLYDSEVISTNANYILPGGSLYEFGVLTSLLHNDWMRLVAGRIKSDYRYTASVVFNAFPWPEVNSKQQKTIEQLAEEILFVREDFPGKTLADLYNPETMPQELLVAHQELDSAVDKLYRGKPFKDTPERLSFLLARYEEMVAR